MRFTPTAIPDVMRIEPAVFGDARGFFFESWNRRDFEAVGLAADFVQDNHSRSARNVTTTGRDMSRKSPASTGIETPSIELSSR